MKKLSNITIDTLKKELSFLIQLDTPLNENEFMIFLDECHNIDNFQSTQSHKHCYYFNKHNSDITFTSIENNVYIITIIHNSIGKMTNHMKYIKVKVSTDEFVDGIYYSSVLIFNAELNKIKSTCTHCLDDECMQLVMHIVFKKQLIEQAIESKDYIQCILLYKDLCRLLKIDNKCSCNCCGSN